MQAALLFNVLWYCRSLFRDSDDEEGFAGFNGDLDDYDMKGDEDEEYVILRHVIAS